MKLPTYPSPKSTLTLRTKCWLRGGVGGQFATPEGTAIRVGLKVERCPPIEGQGNLKNGRVQL